MPWKMKITLWTLVVFIIAGYVLNMAFVLVNKPSDQPLFAGLALLFATFIGAWTAISAVVTHYMPRKQTKKKETPDMKNRYSIVIAALVLSLTSSACTRVSPGHVGIVVNQWGSEKGVSDYAAKTGSFAYNPFTTSVYNYPVYTQNYVWTANLNEGKAKNEEITFTIKGNMVISVDVSIAYSLDPAKVPAFYVQFRSDDLSDFTHGFLHNVTRDCFNETGGRYELDQVMGDNADFILAVRTDLEKRVGQYGVKIDQFGLIGAPRPPEEVRKAITAKIGATQLAIQKQNEIVQAEADAKKRVAQASGEAQSILMVAEAQAKANRILSESLTANFLTYKSYEKWDGKLPQITSGAIPLVNFPK